MYTLSKMKMESSVIYILAPRTRWTHDNVMWFHLYCIFNNNHNNKTEAETTENKKIYRKTKKQKIINNHGIT